MSAADEAAARAFYRFLAPTPPRKIELKVIRPGAKARVAWARSEDEFIHHIRRWNGRRDIYAGAAHRLSHLQRSARYLDLASIGAYAIDIDPEPGDAAAMREAANVVAKRVFAWFLDRHFAAPMIVSSGGGLHLWFSFPTVQFDYPNRIIAARVRRRLKERLPLLVDEIANVAETEGAAAKVDRSIKDLTRVFRVPGTMNCKRQLPTGVVGQLERREDARLLEYLDSLAPAVVEKGKQTAARAVPVPQAALLRSAGHVVVPPISLTVALKTERNPTVWQRLGALLRGNREGYRSASEAEVALAVELVRLGYSDRLISAVIHRAQIPSKKNGIGKWASAAENYWTSTLRFARKSARHYRFKWAEHGPEGDAIVRTQKDAASTRNMSRFLSLSPGAQRAEIERAYRLICEEAERMRRETPPAMPARAAPKVGNGTRFVVRRAGPLEYSPEVGLSLLRLDGTAVVQKGRSGAAYGTGKWFSGSVLRVPEGSKAKAFQRRDKAWLIRFGNAGKRSGWAAIQAALATARCKLPDSFPLHVAIWRRGSRAGAHFSARVVTHQAAEGLVAEAELLAISKLWPEAWMAFQKRRLKAQRGSRARSRDGSQ